MSDLISRADVICEVLVNDGIDNIVDRINALPSAELPKGDLISRDDVLKYPIRLDHYDEENGSREFVYGVESVIEYVESLPSADAVQGEWIEVEDYNGDVHYKCDQCGEEWTFPFGTPKENNANFCPNCGARMENTK